MKTDELKRCPFCGASAELCEYPDKHCNTYGVTCANPECIAHSICETYETEKEAIAAWNRRAEPENKPLAEAITDANDLIRTLICKNEPYPCEWCDAQSCKSCRLYTENQDDPCVFSLAYTSHKP